MKSPGVAAATRQRRPATGGRRPATGDPRPATGDPRPGARPAEDPVAPGVRRERQPVARDLLAWTPVTDRDDPQRIMRGCERWLAGRRPLSAAEQLRRAADALDPAELPDHYGEGEIVERFEAEMAQRLGAEAAVLMPSGTMAQQIALRIHCERRGRDTIAFHPTCHLELWEHGGYAHLHGLRAELVGGRDRLIELADLEALTMPLGALLLELPQREIGGQLPEWEALEAQLAWAAEHGIARHLDGARIWEAAPYLGRTTAEIAGRFDTVYVSLYKGLGGLAGSVLAGPAEIIAPARIWRRRHGGTLPALYPLVAAARPGLDEVAPRMGEFLDHARAVARALAEVPGIAIVPAVPQTPMFHVHLTGEPDELWARALEIARERRVWLGHRPRPALLPGTSVVELSLYEAALEVSPAEAAELFAALVAR
jgi:threonine aldolase